MSNFYDNELLQTLAEDVNDGLITVSNDSTEYFSRLASEFPTTGSRIDWDNVPNAITTHSENNGKQESDFVDFFNHSVIKNGLEGQVIWVGDGVTNIALILSVDVLRKHLRDILSIPQHHYFIGEDFKWCIVFSFEGDMGFGKRLIS